MDIFNITLALFVGFILGALTRGAKVEAPTTFKVGDKVWVSCLSMHLEKEVKVGSL